MKQNIIRISQEILDHLLAFKMDHPEFTFATRERDSVQSDEKRLDVGQWFQGSHYIYVPLFNRGDKDRKIKTIGFVVRFEDNGDFKDSYLEVSFKGGVTDQKEIDFHRELAQRLGITLDRYNNGKKLYSNPENYIENLNDYLTRVYPLCLELLKKYDLEDKYLIPETEFNRRLGRIQAIQQNLINPVKVNLIKTNKVKKSNSIVFNQLNRILYGPPGTGKTYRLQQLIKEMDLVQHASSPSAVPNYQNFVSGLSWWQLMAMALLEVKRSSVPDLLEHPLIKAKLAISNIQHPPQRLWSTLQHHTVKDCPHVKGDKRFGELLFYKEADSTWRLDNENDFRQQLPFLVSEWETFAKGSGPVTEQRHYTFLTCHQSLAYEDFIEGIKPTLEQKEEGEGEEKLQYQIRKGLFYQACEKAAQRAGFESLKDALNAGSEKRSEQFTKALSNNQIHVVFLDEINRCNVSAVFGELITLIEDDKRLGAQNEIADTVLPYSQTLFGIPANLLIIGTMNTADRSVEALDTALRRRFVFEEMVPRPDFLEPKEMLCTFWNKPEHIELDDEWEQEPYLSKADAFYNLIGLTRANETKVLNQGYEEERLNWLVSDLDILSENDFTGINMGSMLKAINLRLEALLSKDHTIGHAWLMGVYSFDELQNAFKHKILPLLQEYFYNNYAKIGLVLGSSFIDVKESKGVFSKGFKDAGDLISDYEDKVIYSLKDPFQMELDDFKSIYE